MTEINLVRHGESTWNSEHRWAGHADPPLTKTGRAQARNACTRLKGMGFRFVVSSTLKRAWETAVIIASELAIELAPPCLELNERHSGDISGFTSHEINVRFPGLLDAWRSGGIIDIPGGEPWPVFAERILKALNTLSLLQGPVLAISHEGVLRAVEYHLGQRQTKHGNLEGLWIRMCNECVHPIAKKASSG